MLLAHAGNTSDCTAQDYSVLNSSPGVTVGQLIEREWSDSVVSNELLQTDINYEQTVELFTESDEYLVQYLAGWVAKKCGICNGCQMVLSKPTDEHGYCRPLQSAFLHFKQYSELQFGGLVTPCVELTGVVHIMEQLFRNNYSKLLSAKNVARLLYDIIYPECEFSFLFKRYPEHALYLGEKIVKLYVTMRLFYAVKFKNREINAQRKCTVAASDRQSQSKRKMQKVLHQ